MSHRAPGRGAIVLCGDRSERLGRDKASLAFGAETLLQRAVRRVARSVGDVVVVARSGQSLPDLPAAVRVVRDEIEDQGRLGGLRTTALFDRLRTVRVTESELRAVDPDVASLVSCNTPEAHAAAIEMLAARPRG